MRNDLFIFWHVLFFHAFALQAFARVFSLNPNREEIAIFLSQVCSLLVPFLFCALISDHPLRTKEELIQTGNTLPILFDYRGHLAVTRGTSTGRKNGFTSIANLEQIICKCHICLILLNFAT